MVKSYINQLTDDYLGKGAPKCMVCGSILKEISVKLDTTAFDGKHQSRIGWRWDCKNCGVTRIFPA